MINCASGKTIDAGQYSSKTIQADAVLTVSINYRAILLIVLFITSWCKLLKTDPSRVISTMPLDLSFLLPNKHSSKICYYST